MGRASCRLGAYCSRVILRSSTYLLPTKFLEHMGEISRTGHLCSETDGLRYSRSLPSKLPEGLADWMRPLNYRAPV